MINDLTIDDYLSIASEIKELEDLLSTIPEDYQIERLSLESRLNSVKAALATLLQQSETKQSIDFHPDNIQ